MPVILYAGRIVSCAGKLSKIGGKHSYFKRLGELYKYFSKTDSKFSQSLNSGATGDTAIISEYIKILTMNDINFYNNSVGSFNKYSAEFIEMYKLVGRIDSAVSVLSFRKSLDYYCLPEFGNSSGIFAKQIYHPLIFDPVANDLDSRKDILITGSNASGKSSFIKALAINGILAQTINTCTAEKFSIKPCMIITSMAVKDDVFAGDSYFMAEIKSLKRIIDMSKKRYTISFIDEILKGTNTVERIAASSSVMSYLHNTDCVCVTATHDIELTEILSGKFENFHFCETVTDSGVEFDYKIKNGPSVTRNALLLLRQNEFDKDIVDKAENLADNFLNKRKWESI